MNSFFHPAWRRALVCKQTFLKFILIMPFEALDYKNGF